jgi:prolipoprotein diacylglyceryltransferase
MRKFKTLKDGKIFGIFLIVLFGVRFLIEFLKQPQVAFEQNMTLNMGQWLSIPFIIAGIGLLWWVNKQSEKVNK